MTTMLKRGINGIIMVERAKYWATMIMGLMVFDMWQIMRGIPNFLIIILAVLYIGFIIFVDMKYIYPNINKMTWENYNPYAKEMFKKIERMEERLCGNG